MILSDVVIGRAAVLSRDRKKLIRVWQADSYALRIAHVYSLSHRLDLTPSLQSQARDSITMNALVGTHYLPGHDATLTYQLPCTVYRVRVFLLHMTMFDAHRSVSGRRYPPSVPCHLRN